MKNKSLFIFILLLFSFSFVTANIKIEKNDWVIAYDEVSKLFDYSYKGNLIFSKAYSKAKYDVGSTMDVIVTSSSYSDVSLSEEAVNNDAFGTGTVYTVKFENLSSSVSMEQRFYFYDNYTYFLTDVRLVGVNELKSNYLAPIVSETQVSILPKTSENRMILVPWDNDDFIRYQSNRLTTTKTSFEVTSMYNATTRRGLVVGSVEHDTWKNAIRIKASGDEYIDEIECFSGVSTVGESYNYTRDNLPHGKVKGTMVCSAKMLVGYFDDWRLGMEAYGNANALIVPARTTWTKGTPFGWNSWAVLLANLSYTAANENSLFLKDELYDKGFHNEQGAVIVDLDSFWDNMPRYMMKTFADNCKKRGQTPGIYWCPFSHWGNSLDDKVLENDTITFKSCVLYENGIARKQGGYCLDPTHPAVKKRIKAHFDMFKEWGYEYIKLDFVSNAAIQGDSYYNSEVTTAVQAYNEGFEYLVNEAGDDMYIALSIAPMFPYQYGNSRRISCDAWGKIGHSEYVMNALSFGWWTDQIYQFNDPDHLLLIDRDSAETEGENRARVTTGAITGMFLFGDNFSLKTSEYGNPALARERALTMLTNENVNKLAREGKSFMPVYGNKAGVANAENLFMLHTDDYLYLACINYKTTTILSGSVSLSFLGIDVDNVESVRELWADQYISLNNGNLEYFVAPRDAKIFRFKKKNGGSDIADTTAEDILRVWVSSPGIISVSGSEPMDYIEVYGAYGQLISFWNRQQSLSEIQILTRYTGVSVVKCFLKNGDIRVKKIILS